MVKVILPPAAAIEAAANELTATAVAAGDTKRQIAVNKAAYDLLIGQPAIARISGAYLVPSTSRGGLVHRLDDVSGCSCEAGRAGRSCRHAIAVKLVELANTRTMPALPRRVVTLAQAQAEIDELFA